MKTKSLLVDAQNLLKLSFHGNQTTYDKNFGYIGCLVTFFTIIRKVIKERNINKVILFWDGINSGRLRHEIYSEYKSNRDGKNFYNSELILSEKDILREENSDKSLLEQRERIKQYAEELFFRQIEDPICEADDCIAYYCNNGREPDEQVIIFSADQDFCQLISENVFLYLANKKSIITPRSYYLEFDHHISNSALVKAVVGCKSDYIHGIKGLQEKGLLKLFPEIRTHQVTFDYLYERAVEINSKRKKPIIALKNLIEGTTSVENPMIRNGKDLFNLNYKLVNLKEPFLTEECIDLIETETKEPLSCDDRGGKNLLRLMFEDGFINFIPRGVEGYIDFLKEFLPVVKREKTIYENYLKDNQ